jgi:transcriptional regulator with XRE-family HTH domain
MLPFYRDSMPRKPKALSGPALGARIGRKIKSARNQLGMTQGQLAEALGIENVTMSRIETGSQLPSLERLQHLAETLHVPLQALLAEGEEGSETSKVVTELLEGLPERERKFLLDFVMNYARHWKAGQESLS